MGIEVYLTTSGTPRSSTDPGTWKQKYKQHARLSFLREQLLYDVKNIAYVEGDVISPPDEHDRHQIMDICEDGNIDRVTRVLDLGVAHCRELLFPYSRSNINAEETRDDVLTSPEEYLIELNLPDDFSQSTLTYLEKLIHEYLVYWVLMDWMSITNLRNPGSASSWAAKMKSLEDDIESTLNARIHRVRRTMSPFGPGG